MFLSSLGPDQTAQSDEGFRCLHMPEHTQGHMVLPSLNRHSIQRQNSL